MKNNFRENTSIAFIESNTTGTGELFITKSLLKGLRVYFLTANPKKYNFLNKLSVQITLIDTNDVEQISTFLKNVEDLQGVLSSSEYFIEVASRVSKNLGLNHLNIDAIIACRNKRDLFNKLSDNKVPTPFTRVVKSLDEVLALSSSVKYPIVVKPNSGSGSIGVRLCNNSQDFVSHSKTLIGSKIGGSLNILVQEYLDGDEFSVEVVCFNSFYHVLGITRKRLSSLPYFVEVGHDFPALLPQKQQKEIVETAIDSLKAVNYNFGPSHIELRLNDNGISIIEINPRLVGGMVPILIEQSLGIDLIDEILNLYVYNRCNLKPIKNYYSAIRFFLPDQSGTLIKVEGEERARLSPNTICVNLYKKAGEKVSINNDFRDRLGYVITSAKDTGKCHQSMKKAIKEISFVIDNKITTIDNFSRERLSLNFDSTVIDILNPKANDSFLDELKCLSEIDKAHLIMLEKSGIIERNKISLILKEILGLEKQRFDPLRNNASFRGSYLIYESYLIDRLGIDIGGVIHTGRSRNDINATLFKLKARTTYVEIYRTLWKLRSTLLEVADRSRDIILPIYSQYQPALPGTYSYYLLAIEEALSRDQIALKDCLDSINTATLGAGAGAGTTFPIAPLITAELLGFDALHKNALDVVASRDLALRLLSIGSILGITVSRIAQDLQMWTTQEFYFFELPDSLCGTSSSMPQKKNPYLLEKIKGKISQISGCLFSSLNIMNKVPFSNSVEVGTEALSGFEPGFQALTQAIQLLERIIDQAKPVINNTITSSRKGLTLTAGLTESLVRKNNLSFREAHHLIGKAISLSINVQEDPLLEMASKNKDFTDNPADWHKEFNYGGGPGEISIEKMMSDAKNRLESHSIFILHALNKWEKAKLLLDKEVSLLVD